MLLSECFRLGGIEAPRLLSLPQQPGGAPDQPPPHPPHLGPGGCRHQVLPRLQEKIQPAGWAVHGHLMITLFFMSSRLNKSPE